MKISKIKVFLKNTLRIRTQAHQSIIIAAQFDGG